MNSHPAISNANDEEWDSFVAYQPEGYHEQSSLYGAQRKAWQFQCERIVVRDSGDIVAGVQILFRSTPIGVAAHILRGPIISNNSPETLACLIDELDAVAKRHSFAWIRVDTFPDQLLAQEALGQAGFEACQSWAGIEDSQIVTLSGDDEQILAGMKSKGRYNVRLAMRSGVEIVVDKPETIEAFHDLYYQTATHQKFPTYSRQYFEYIWATFKESSKVNILVAYHQNEPVAAILNLICGQRTYYCWGGMSRLPEHRKLMANYLLHYTAMSIARDKGCMHYDLIGISPFKNKLGGELVKWPSPLWKYYGPLKGIRRKSNRFAWSNSHLRPRVESAIWRLFPAMPH